MNLLDQLKEFDRVYAFVDSDLDGTSCKIFLTYALELLGRDAEFIQQTAINGITVGYEAEFKKPFIDFVKSLTKKDIVIFADLVPSPLELQALQLATNVWIFDHHPTSMEILGPFDTYFYDVENCSAKIIYLQILAHLVQKPCVSQYADLVDVYDRYQKQDPRWIQARSINIMLWKYISEESRKAFMSGGSPDEQIRKRNLYAGYGRRNFIECFTKKLHRLEEFRFFDREQAIIDKEFENEKKELAKCMKDTLSLRVDSEGNIYAFAQHYRKLSELADLIQEANPQVKYVVMYKSLREILDAYHMSCRSRTFVVKRIAEKYAGGGHEKAAAFNLGDNPEFAKDFIAGKVHLL